MLVIGFFRDLLGNFGQLVEFVSTPISDLYGAEIAVIGDLSIIQCMSVSIGITLGVFLVIHLVRLLVGG